MDGKYIQDGVYDVSGIAYVFIADEFDGRKFSTNSEVAEFMRKYPDFVIAAPYNTYGYVFLEREPPRLEGEHVSPRFNYGACVILDVSRASKILIVAEND